MTLTRDTAPDHVKGTDERYTPHWIVDRCGVIGLDPCAPAHNPTGALVHYTKADNGLAQPWRPSQGCVWVNPPYSTGQVSIWADKIQDEYCSGCHPIYALTSGDFTTKWWPRLYLVADACVLLSSRVPYIYPGEDTPRPGSNFGNVIWGYTHDTAEFFSRFGDLGYPLKLR